MYSDVRTEPTERLLFFLIHDLFRKAQCTVLYKSFLKKALQVIQKIDICRNVSICFLHNTDNISFIWKNLIISVRVHLRWTMILEYVYEIVNFQL